MSHPSILTVMLVMVSAGVKSGSVIEGAMIMALCWQNMGFGLAQSQIASGMSLYPFLPTRLMVVVPVGPLMGTNPMLHCIQVLEMMKILLELHLPELGHSVFNKLLVEQEVLVVLVVKQFKQFKQGLQHSL
jgi:hypothetical protein